MNLYFKIKVTNPLFHSFRQDISEIEIPEKFTFPFHYEPHELSIIACKELQEYLKIQTDFIHDFGLNENKSENSIGKMFGILVVQNEQGELGYLSAFSGKLANSNFISHFVPTVFDTLEEEGFYKKEEAILNEFNIKIDNLKNDPSYLDCIQDLENLKVEGLKNVQNQKDSIKISKRNRDSIRNEFNFEFDITEDKLKKESQEEKSQLKKTIKMLDLKW